MTLTAKHLVLSSALLAIQSNSLVYGSTPTTFKGYGTVYDVGSPSSGNCNFMTWPDEAVTMYAALNADQWDDTMNCGRCAEVWCTDASCSGRSSEIVYILDQCPGCSHGDLDLSPAVFKSVMGQSPSKLSIAWKFVDCPVSNNVQYCLKSGSSEFWVAIQPANFASGVESLKINGQKTSMVDSAYYFLIDGSGTSVASLDSVSISLTGLNGEVLEETLSLTADTCTEGSSQFSYSGDAVNTTTSANTVAESTFETTAPVSESAASTPTSAPALSITSISPSTSSSKRSNVLHSGVESTPAPALTSSVKAKVEQVSGALKSTSLEAASMEVSTDSPCSTPTLEANVQSSGGLTSKRVANGMVGLVCGCALAAIVLALYVCRRKTQIDDRKYPEELLTPVSGEDALPRAPDVSSSYSIINSPIVDSSAIESMERCV